MRAPRTVALCLLVALALGACDVSRERPSERPTPRGVTLGATLGSPTERSRLWPAGRGGTVVVETTRWRFLVYDRPSTEAVVTHRLWADNPWGQPLRYEVLAAERDRSGEGWFRVRLPIRPNGSKGWVRARDVTASRIHRRIVVDLSAHTLRAYVRGSLRSTIRVAAGAASTPTPPGSYFVWAHVGYDDPTGPYGAYALGLSGFSRVLTGWPGGGRLAIHGTADATDIGRDVSHGCVRVYNPDILATLRGVPLGTPVLIRP